MLCKGNSKNKTASQTLYWNIWPGQDGVSGNAESQGGLPEGRL